MTLCIWDVNDLVRSLSLEPGEIDLQATLSTILPSSISRRAFASPLKFGFGSNGTQVEKSPSS